MNETDLIQSLSELRSNATFLSIKGYENDKGEVSDYNLVFHASYKNSLERSLEILHNTETSNELDETARRELIESVRKSIASFADNETEEEHYASVSNKDGAIVKGIKLHKETNALHLYGMVIGKRVIKAGTYKEKNRRPLTVAKDNIRKTLPLSKFRQFKISPEKFNNISVEKMNLSLSKE